MRHDLYPPPVGQQWFSEMIPESLSLKLLGLMGGALAGLTVLVRLGRLLQIVERLQVDMTAMGRKVDELNASVARLQGQVDP